MSEPQVPGVEPVSESAQPAVPGSPAMDSGPGAQPAGGQLPPPVEEPVDDIVVAQHSITIGGERLNYTTRTGRVVLRTEAHTDDAFDGHVARAEVFVTAYTLDGADPATRPVTFAFNGGPGSSSVWLHMGLLGPRRVLMGDAGSLLGPPYRLADNTETLLVHSDLVFIDPVSTGYSRAVKGTKPKEYHGYTGDVEAVGEIIRLWTSRHCRWLSPKFLAGESYGTLRAAGLADHLQSRFGMYLNGLILISSVLDFGTGEFTGHNDTAFALYLPTYAAIAHHHGLHGDRPLREVLDEAEEFAARDYPWALARGSRLSTKERASTAATIAALTGLSEDYVDRVNLRIEHVRFFTELLRERRRVVGRLDGRFTGFDADYGRELFTEDPSYTAILGPYSGALNHYVRAELRYGVDLPYEILTSRVHPWSYKEFEGQFVHAADKLASAMRANPHLRVHVACGYHDGATPYFAAVHTFAHLAIPDELAGNVEFKFYEAGHMMYVHEPSRLQQSADIAEFVTGRTRTD